MTERLMKKHIEDYKQLWHDRDNGRLLTLDGVRFICEGWHASPEKIVAAAAHSIELLPGQTWVESYTKGAIVA